MRERPALNGCGVQDVRDGRQQLLNELDRVRHEHEALQEENVQLQSECERLSLDVAQQQHRSADATRDWRIRSDEQGDGASSIGVVTEGFYLPHDVEQLQERVLELEEANRLLSSSQSQPVDKRSPPSTVTDQDVVKGGFIDEKRQLEALQTRSVASESFALDSTADDAEISPIPSPVGLSGFAESHSPAYERLKAEFIAYKQKAQKDCAKLKARLVSTVREYNELKSCCALGASPSQSPVLWSSVSPVADILASQSMLREQMSPANGRHSASGWHCREAEVQTDLCDINRCICTVSEVPAVDSRTAEQTVESLPSEAIQDIQPGLDSRQIHLTASVQDRCTTLEMELSVLQSQYSALVQENASLTELVGYLREEGGKRERSTSVTEAPAAEVADSGSTTADTSSDLGTLISESQRWRQEGKTDKSQYEDKLRQLEERCLQENARLKQLLSDVKAGAEHSDDADSSSSCRHCAELAEKCRVLETSAELSGLNAERRLREAEESRSMAADLQSRLDQLSADDRNMVSKTRAGYVDSCVVTNTFVVDSLDGLITDKTVTGTDNNAFPACTVGHDLVQPPFYSPGNDVDLEVAEIFAPRHKVAACSTVNSDLTMHDLVGADDLSSSFVSCEDLSDGDCRISHGELNSTISLHAQYETPAVHDSHQSAVVTKGHLAENETESDGLFPDVSMQQHLVTSSPCVIQEESTLQQNDSTETAAQKAEALLENRTTETSPVSSAKASSAEASGNSTYNTQRVKSDNGFSLRKHPWPLSSSDIVNSLEEATSSVDVNERDQAAVDGGEGMVTSPSPSSGASSSAAVLENVTRLVSQNETMLRRNRAWTAKLKREYELAADELRTMKNRYETVVCEKEKVRADLPPAREDIKRGGPSEVKQADAGKRTVAKKEGKTTAIQKQKDTSVPTAAYELSSEIAELKIQYETLLDEKSEMRRRYEVQRLELLKKLEGKDLGLAPAEAAETMRTLQDADSTEVKSEEMSHNLTVASSCCREARGENSDVNNQPGVTALNASCEDSAREPTIHESRTANVSADPYRSTLAASYSSDQRANLHADDAVKPASQSMKYGDAASLAAAAAHGSAHGIETAPLFDTGVELVPAPAVDFSLHQDEVHTTKIQSSRPLSVVSQSSVDVTDESHAIKVYSMFSNSPAGTPTDVSAAVSSSVQMELELLRLAKRELCATLEMEERKCAELQQQRSELASNMEALTARSSELEKQLSTARIQLEIVWDEKVELCRQCGELSAELEAARMSQVQGDGTMQHQTSVQNSCVDAVAIASESVVMEDVTNSDAADTSPAAQRRSQELAAEIIELKAALDCVVGEKLGLHEQLDQCHEQHRCLLEKVDEITEQLGDVTKSRDDALHAAENDLQELTAAKSSLEITNTSLARQLEALKSRCSSLQDEADVVGSMQLELETTNRDKQLQSQRCDELLLDLSSMQQQVARLEEENVDFRATLHSLNDRNECLVGEIADVRGDCDLLSTEKEKLSVENSVAKSAKSLLEERCSKLEEMIEQLELSAAETRRQHEASVEDLRSALERKQNECSVLLDELSAAKLSAELSALKLHDGLKANEQQRQQLVSAETVVRDLEGRLREKQNEVQSLADLRVSAETTVDEVSSQLVLLQSENKTISAALSELTAEKDQLLSESQSQSEALEAELLRKATEISSLREKVVEMGTSGEQLVNELESVNTALCETRHESQQEKLFHEQQMTSLKEEMAEERASVKSVHDAHSVELEKMTSKCSSIELQLSAAKTENDDVRQELQQAVEEIEKQRDLATTLTSEYRQCKDDAETQLTEVRSVRDGLADSLAECREEKRRVEEKLDRLAGELDSCKGELAAVIEEIVVFKDCNDELKLSIALSQRNEEDLAGELQQLRAEHAESCASHESEMDERKQMVLRAEKERDELRGVHEQSCQAIDETIAKYTEVKAQLCQLRDTNNMLVHDLDVSNQRCCVVSSENERLQSASRELVDSLSSKSAEVGLLTVENKAVQAKVIELSSEVNTLHEQLVELVGKESALREEAGELQFANSQLHLELEQNCQLSHKLDDSRKHTERVESELGELKVAHRMLLDREEKLAEEMGLLTASRDGLAASLQSDTQTHQLERENLRSQIAEMGALLCAARDNISSLQVQKQDVENVRKLVHDCVANCVLEASRYVTTEDTDVEAEGGMLTEVNDTDDVERLNWLQVCIGRKGKQLQRLRDELKTCRESLTSEESLRVTDHTLMQKMEEECKRLEDELAAKSRQHEESSSQHAELRLQLHESTRENERLLEEHRIVTDLQSSNQEKMSFLTDEITALKSTVRQLEETNAEKEKCSKVQDSEFSSLMEDYNRMVAEKNAQDMETRSLYEQMEAMQKEQLGLETELKAARASNSALEEKLSQAVADLQQECRAQCVKVSQLEESLTSERCESRTLADSVEKYRTILDEISHVVTFISQKCRNDYPDGASGDEVGATHNCGCAADDVLNQYSFLSPSLDLIANCCRRATEERSQQAEKVDALVGECELLRAQAASVDMSVDVGLQELQDEVARLFQVKTDLENEVMHLRAENAEAKDAYDRREAEAAAEVESHEQKITDLHHLLDMASQSKEALETELLCERNEFERNLAAARCESLVRAGRSEDEQRKIVEQLSDAENHLAGLRDRLRASQDERDLLQLRLAYVTRECTVKEQHLDDLRAQVATQRTHIEDAMREHRDTIQLLVELRLEQQLGRREQLGEFSRLEEEILRLEAHVESCSSRVATPQTMSLLDAPVSPQPSLPVDSVHRTNQDTAAKTDHDQTLQPSPDDVAYEALETKHFQLVQELSEFKQQLLDLQEANKCLTNVNVVLKQHVETKTSDSSLPDSASLCSVTEHKSSLDFSRRPYRVQSCEQFSSIGSAASLASVDQRVVGINIPVEMLGLQAKVVRLQKDYQALADENGELRTSLLAKQDELVKQMELVRDKQKKRSFRFSSSSTSENVAAVTEVSGQQIQLLQKERDELRCRLDAAKSREDEAALLSDRVEQLEDVLSRERQKFHKLYQEKETVEIQLLRERLTVEKHVREFQHLQGLVSKKDRLEQQLQQKTSAGTVPDSSGTRQQILQDKKSQLVVEIRRRVLYRDVALQVGESSLRPGRRTASQVKSVQPAVRRPTAPMAVERSLRLDCGCVTELGTMRMRAGCRYHQAVERLRRELKAQDAAACKTGKHAGIH